MTPVASNITRLLLLGTLAILLGIGSRRLTDPLTARPYSATATMDEKYEEVQEILRKFVREADSRRVRFVGSLSEVTIVPDMDSEMGGDLRLAQPLAYCIPGTNQIRVNDLHWDSMNETAKEQVLFHELGHCMLRRAHREDTLPEGRKVSIMSARKRWVKNQTYLTHRKEYLDELFDPKYRGDLTK